MRETVYDAIVVGAGPNGLAAAISLARAGRSVLVLEAEDTVGGGTRSAALTLPGYVHDVCSAVHPLALASPFFRTLPLEQCGVAFIHPPVPLAHPLPDGTAVLLERSLQATSEGLGPDGAAYSKFMGPLASRADKLVFELLGPLRPPRHPLALARFWPAIRSAAGLARSLFRGERARALFAGMAAHSMLPLEQSPSAAAAMMLGMLGHSVGWPVIRGGSQKLAEAMAVYLASLGGVLLTNRRVESLDELPPARAVLLDVTARQLLKIAGHHLPPRYRRGLERYRYGPGVYKVDWAMDGPIPWKAVECARAGTVHVGGTLEELVTAEDEVARGSHPERPYVLLAQPSLLDPTRAPAGKHTAWAYCHVPHGSAFDMAERIEAQIDRFAPGFKRRVIARSTMGPAALERHDANLVGGDINGGIQDLWQLYTRPVARLVPYTTPNRQLYICSSSTPPGGGVHGMCGAFAAQAALRRALR